MKTEIEIVIIQQFPSVTAITFKLDGRKLSASVFKNPFGDYGMSRIRYEGKRGESRLPHNGPAERRARAVLIEAIKARGIAVPEMQRSES